MTKKRVLLVLLIAQTTLFKNSFVMAHHGEHAKGSIYKILYTMDSSGYSIALACTVLGFAALRLTWRRLKQIVLTDYLLKYSK